MRERSLGPNTWLWATVAIAAFAWAMIAVIFAAVGPWAYVPVIFHNRHVEHFVAFYALAILAAAGMPRARLGLIVLSLAALAAALAVARFMIPIHQLAAAEDFLADIAGELGAVAPIFVGRFRELAVARAPSADRT